MKRCSAKPYEGTKEYIFVSYCHKDKARVFPVIEQLAKDGYRVWYDEGIDPGSEWPEIIAQHLNGCTACIAFISENSLNSHNCRREINYALLKNKAFISIILEMVEMLPGMEMQLSATQSIFKYKLTYEYEFFDKLYTAQFLNKCKGEPDNRVVVSKSEDYEIEQNGLFESGELKREPFSNTWFTNTASNDVKKDIENKEVGKKETEVAYTPQPAEKKCEEICWLLHERLNKKVILNNGETKFGRSGEKCDYVIPDNGTVGRYHARILNQASRCVVIDNRSLNKTYLNDKPIEPERAYFLNDGDCIKFSNEKFIFHRTVE